MKSIARLLPFLALAILIALLLRWSPRRGPAGLEVHHAVAHDLSPPLSSLRGFETAPAALDCAQTVSGCGTSPANAPDRDDPDDPDATPLQGRGAPNTPPPPPPIPPAGLAVEQRTQGTRPAAVVIASFDGMGFGFSGPQGPGRGGNPSDNSLAVGPNHIVQIVNGSGIAIFSKQGEMFDTTGKVLYGAVPSKSVFKGFGGACEAANFGDVVVRYDQLADRWLYVMPIFQRIPDRPDEPYSMCYALSEGADPLGPYYRYEFPRKLFPDYPRPAVWPDGYYTPSSTGDNVIQKHDCIVDRASMLKGKDSTEQCLVIDGVNFLNNADIDGQTLPPPGAPNIMMAAGGTQLKEIYDGDAIFAWKVHVDWKNPNNTAAAGPIKIPVAPYHYLCNGQLTNCVPQPGTTVRLDAQGDKLMQRLVYRKFADHESIVAVHSINTSAKAGGVRWYELRLDAKGDPALYQQATYAPDEFYRWMASPDMDHVGNIGIGYSFGGTSTFAGQRFAARMAGDPLGQLTVHETVLVNGEGAQPRGNRWEDYATTTLDPSDDCTFWYVGDYYKSGAITYTTRIGAVRLPGCLHKTVNGFAFFDLNHNGKRDLGEPGLEGVVIDYAGAASGNVITGANGNFAVTLPADPIYQVPTYTIAGQGSTRVGWQQTGKALTVTITDPAATSSLNFGSVCTGPNQGGDPPKFWAGGTGKAVLNAHDPEWRRLVAGTVHLDLPDKPSLAYSQFHKWLARPSVQTQLAALALNAAFGAQDGKATVHDPVANDWPTITALVARVSALKPAGAEAYRSLLEKLNANTQPVTPSSPAGCSGF
jgi:hypothetical protein